MLSRWGKYIKNDPMHNPNLGLHNLDRLSYRPNIEDGSTAFNDFPVIHIYKIKGSFAFFALSKCIEKINPVMLTIKKYNIFHNTKFSCN